MPREFKNVLFPLRERRIVSLAGITVSQRGRLWAVERIGC